MSRECERLANDAVLRRGAETAILPAGACAVDSFTEFHDAGGAVPLSIARARTALRLLALCAGGACTPRSSAVGAPLHGPPPTVTFACSSVLSLRVRLDASSAAVTIDGDGPYTLSQVVGRSGVTVYTDGQRVLEFRESVVSFGLTPRILQACIRAS